MSHEPAISQLAEIDRRLSARGRPLESLCPGRETATPLETLGRALLYERVEDEAGRVFAAGMERVVDAVLEAFPGNLFWDLDFLAASLVSSLRAGQSARFAESVELVVTLQQLFGRETEIHFRYAHDFLYGFDWAKWVARDPGRRASVGPFELECLRYLHQRGHELFGLIEVDDAKYGRLPPGEHRNAFPFSREPEAERTLHRDLARSGLLPVEAWRIDAKPHWDRSYADLRVERARALGIPPR